MPGSPLRTVAIASGKSGVGKTNLAVNLGIALSRLGQRVLILDGDPGTASADVLLGIRSQYNLKHVIDGSRVLEQVVIEGPEGLSILSGGASLYDMASISEDRAATLLRSAARIERRADVMLIDAAAGITSTVTKVLLNADETLVMTSPEPTAITEAYSLLKIISKETNRPKIHLIVNMVRDESEAEATAVRLINAAEQFLGLEVDFWGSIPSDANVANAVRRQVPFLVANPRSGASKSVLTLASQLLAQPTEIRPQAGLGKFFSDLLSR
jgi:flagellar biosynthesis protein FlhG